MTRDPDVIDRAAQLEKFMRRWNLDTLQAAETLGVSQRMIYWYRNGKHSVPKSVSLLMQSLAKNWKSEAK